MIKVTVGDLTDGKLDNLDTQGHHVYTIRDGDVVFYVGQSVCPISRLWGHLGNWRKGFVFGGASELGRIIHCNLPNSRSWQIELLTVSDCNAYSVDDAESKLIFELAPHLNIQGKRRPSGPLPERYKTPWPKVITV